MKLVDILARELEAWPEHMSTLVQWSDGTVPEATGISTNPRFSISCDAGKPVVVTRPEWQAAVDSLYPPLAIQEEWNGEGLPPVGLAVEWHSDTNTGWQEIAVLAYHGNDAWIQPKGKPSIIVVNPAGFRPIRTPEQIAAEECDKAVKAMLAEFEHTGSLTSHYEACEVLHKAGYRKFEIVEGEK